MTKTHHQLLTRIQSAPDIPILPGIASWMSTMDAPRPGEDDITGIINTDPSLTACLLRLANSISFGGTPVTSLAAAVDRLGPKNIRTITLSISMIQLFHNRCFPNYPKFWKHSVSVALATQLIVKFAGNSPSSTPADILYVAGILHDLGILVMDQYCGSPYRKALKHSQLDEQELCVTEQNEFGLTHAEAGAILLERWQIPDFIIQAVRNHHNPCAASPESRPLAQLVHLANFVCNNLGVDNGLDRFPIRFSEATWFDRGFRVEDIPAIIETVNAETAKAEVLVTIAHGS